MVQRWIFGAASMAILWTMLMVAFFEHRVNMNLSEIDNLKEQIAEMKLEKEKMQSDSTDVTPVLQAHTAYIKEMVEEQVADLKSAHTTAMTVHGTHQQERRLGGFHKSSATNARGVGCLEITAAAEFPMNSDSCSNSLPCPPCFIATALSADVDLEIVDCQSARIKSGLSMDASSATHVLELVFINMDAGNTLTIKGCVDTTCASPASTYVLGPLESVIGHCYTAGSSAITFPTARDTTTGLESHCPKGCDSTAPTDLTGSAFTNGLVTATGVTNLNKLGVNGPTSSGSISTAEWDFLASDTNVAALTKFIATSGTMACPKGCDAATPDDSAGSDFTNGMVTASLVSNINALGATTAYNALVKFLATSGTMACPKGCDAAIPDDSAASAFTNGMVTASLVSNINALGATTAYNALVKFLATSGTMACPKGCDDAAPDDSAGSAFTNGMVTTGKVAALNKIGTNSPSGGVDISTTEWDLLAGMTCSASAASSTAGDFTITPAGTFTADTGGGTGTQASVPHGTISVSAIANALSSICTTR